MNDITHPVAATPLDYPDYHRDGYGWAMAQAAIIRAGRIDSIDWENVAEEIESVGKSERSRLKSHLTQVLLHMIKWEVQPMRRGNSWWHSIMNGRDDANDVLGENPSLKSDLSTIFAEALGNARKKAIRETQLPVREIEAIAISIADAFDREVPRPEGD